MHVTRLSHMPPQHLSTETSARGGAFHWWLSDAGQGRSHGLATCSFLRNASDSINSPGLLPSPISELSTLCPKSQECFLTCLPQLPLPTRCQTCREAPQGAPMSTGCGSPEAAAPQTASLADTGTARSCGMLLAGVTGNGTALSTAGTKAWSICPKLLHTGQERPEQLRAIPGEPKNAVAKPVLRPCLHQAIARLPQQTPAPLLLCRARRHTASSPLGGGRQTGRARHVWRHRHGEAAWLPCCSASPDTHQCQARL